APQIIDGFKFTNGQIHAAAARVFHEHPRRLMRVFLYAQQRACRLHPDLAHLIRSELSRVDRSFLYDAHVRETFLEILNQRGAVAPVLRAMHEVGLLGKYVPEFGKLTCLVQHEFYHQYTADEHTLVCLEKLDQCWEAQTPLLQPYAEIFRSLERPFILYLALLLHDAGKAEHTGKHSEVGGQLALRVAKRLALDGETAHALRILIEQHLTMALVAQRRDLEDSTVIRSFAGLIQNRPNLDMLTLHTLADAQATSDKLWNGFKDSLHWMLHDKTRQLLAGGTDFLRAEEKQRELQAEQVARALPRTFSEEELQAHFAGLPPRYFAIHPVKEIASDIVLAHRFMHNQVCEEDRSLEPVLAWHNEPDRGYTSVKVCTWDRAGLFSKITGSLSCIGINILSAQIFTRADGVVFDTFYVTDARTGTLVNKDERERFEGILFKALTGEAPDFHALIARQKFARPLYQSLEGDRIPMRIWYDNDASETRTVIEVETEDRLGILYEISRVFSELDVDISLAKISTEKGAALDTFYVSERDGQKITAPERQKFIEKSLCAALATLAAH
ncbi:MAG TPA: hypothetical protein VGK40_03545, partial [Verrucomicrobiae bacterium]